MASALLWMAKVERGRSGLSLGLIRKPARRAAEEKNGGGVSGKKAGRDEISWARRRRAKTKASGDKLNRMSPICCRADSGVRI